MDAAVRAPAWAGYAMILLAVIVTVLGRHGQRPLNAVMLGAAAFSLTFFGLRGVLHAWVPGAAAVVAAVLAGLFGFVADGWGTAFLLAALLGASAAAGAQAMHLAWAPIAAVGASIGLFIGITRHRRLSVLLPPIFAGVLAAVGAAIAWAPNRRGALLWQLNEVGWVLGLALAIILPLFAISVERDRRRARRLLARTKEMDDDDLKKKIAARIRAE